MKLALGTVQFGVPYGIANSRGQVSPLEVSRILDEARRAGIDTLDTAVAYGNSEEVLGEAGIDDFKIVSKLPPMADRPSDMRAFLFEQVEASLERLKIDHLEALMFHRASDYFGDDESETQSHLRDLKQAGLVRKTGISIYSYCDLDAIREPQALDIIQAPFNVLDRGLETNGWMERLTQQNTEIHTRSAFLQGLLLMDRAERPSKFARWNDLWKHWDDFLANSNSSALSVSLSFVLQNPDIDRIVVGVDSLDHLKEILANCDNQSIALPKELVSNDPMLINPANWPNL